MNDSSSKILGTFLFLILISCIIYLFFFANQKTNKGVIQMIEISGNHLLPVNEYFTFANLEDNTKFANLTLREIKLRFENHPYVEKVDVEYDGDNVVKVYLIEKNIEAVILSSGEPNFISDKFQILPILPGVKFMDLPIISNSQYDNEIKLLAFLGAKDIIEAFKIIESAKLTNEKIFKKLSEINLRKGGDIILTFSGIKPPVLFGKGEAPRKMVYLDIMWSKISDGSNLVDNSDYIDLRFSDEIFIGTNTKTGLAE